MRDQTSSMNIHDMPAESKHVSPLVLLDTFLKYSHQPYQPFSPSAESQTLIPRKLADTPHRLPLACTTPDTPPINRRTTKCPQVLRSSPLDVEPVMAQGAASIGERPGEHRPRTLRHWRCGVHLMATTYQSPFWMETEDRFSQDIIPLAHQVPTISA